MRCLVAKAVLSIIREDIVMAAGPLQLCAGQMAGVEAAIHSVLDHVLSCSKGGYLSFATMRYIRRDLTATLWCAPRCVLNQNCSPSTILMSSIFPPRVKYSRRGLLGHCHEWCLE